MKKPDQGSNIKVKFEVYLLSIVCYLSFHSRTSTSEPRAGGLHLPPDDEGAADGLRARSDLIIHWLHGGVGPGLLSLSISDLRSGAAEAGEAVASASPLHLGLLGDLSLLDEVDIQGLDLAYLASFGIWPQRFWQ